MGVLTASTESPEDEDELQNVDSDYHSSGEETRLLKKKKSAEAGENQKYPRSVFFIIGNEFCERFSYYGLRTVLTLFLVQRLLYSEDTATLIFHAFAMIAYFTPLIGAIIADSWLGKFRTILFLSILYSAGCVTLAAGSFPNEVNTMTTISLIGLLIIGIGTGGIKPCVSAFGGDQFSEGQEKQLQQFFSIFYMAINMGSLVSTFITPVFREDIHCLGQNSCYPLAFGVPAALMILAVLLFVCGKPLYNIRPPEGNILVRVSKCVGHAICRKMKSSEKKKSHWLDYADDKYDKNLIGDIKVLFHVLVLYIPLPVFWALFDQQGSRWTLQATRMDGSLNGYHIKPDQVQVINPLLIILFIPLFEYLVYPLLAKCHLLTKPLQRITTGGVLAALSFVIAGFIELKLETALPTLPSAGHSDLTIINNSPCRMLIEASQLKAIDIDAFGHDSVHELPIGIPQTYRIVPENCESAKEPVDYLFNSTDSIELMMITLDNNKIQVTMDTYTKTKTREGEPLIKILYNMNLAQKENTTFKFVRQGKGIIKEVDANNETAYGITEAVKTQPGRYNIYLSHNQSISLAEYTFSSGGIYIVSFYRTAGDIKLNSTYIELVKGNFLSLFLQLPQYIVITAGEIMFSITGLEFSYSQAPSSMKSVLQAAWLLTVAFGNVIVMIIAELHLFEKQSYELFLFATLMGIDMVIFAILAYRYKYVEASSENDISIAATESSPTGTTNEAYVEETDFNK